MSTADQEIAYLRSSLGVTGGTLNDLRMAFYGGTGSQSERQAAFWRANGGSGMALQELEMAYLRAKTGNASTVTLEDLRAQWFANPLPPQTVVSDTFTGADGSAPAAYWTKATTYPTTGQNTIQGGALRVSTGSTTAWTPAASVFFGDPAHPELTPKPSLDAQYRFDYSLANTKQHYPSIGVRAQSAELWIDGGGANTLKTGCVLVLGIVEGNIDITNGATGATLASQPFTFTTNALKWAFLLAGNRLAFKAWPAASAEPASWTFDNPTILSGFPAGSLGFSIANGPDAETKTVTLDNFVATLP